VMPHPLCLWKRDATAEPSTYLGNSVQVRGSVALARSDRWDTQQPRTHLMESAGDSATWSATRRSRTLLGERLCGQCFQDWPVVLVSEARVSGAGQVVAASRDSLGPPSGALPAYAIS
jgi:hypothetical protein